MISWETISHKIVEQGLKTLLFVLAATFLYFIIKALIVKSLKLAPKGLEPKKKKSAQRIATLTYLTSSLLKFVFFLVSFMMLLKIWGLDPAPLIASAGVIGFAIGFGAQTLIKDLIAGFLIVFENQFNVGDRVKIADAEGKVIKMTLRATYIESEDGNIHIVPNSSITTVIRLPKSQKIN